MSPELLRALITIGFGSLAGGLTNTVAVWMLFHPYRPVRVGPLRLPFLHGAIPKNQDRLAAAVGRTVGGRLLTEEDLSRIFAEEAFRTAFEDRLGAFLKTLLEEERGSPRELVPAGNLAEVKTLLDRLADRVADRVDGWIDSPELEVVLERRITEVTRSLSDARVEGFLTPDRTDALANAAGEWLEGTLATQGFRLAVERTLDGIIEGMLRDDRTVEEVLPGGVAEAVERALAGFLPVATRRLGSILEDPLARARLEYALRELLQRFLRDLRFHQRVVARLVITDDAVERILAALEEEGAERLSEMLRDPAVQDAIARRVNDGALELLRRPATEVLGYPGDPAVQRGRETLVNWILDLARSPTTRGYLLEALRGGLGRMGSRTWGELLEKIPRERVIEEAVRAVRSKSSRKLVRTTIQRMLIGFLDRPLGRPVDWLPHDSASRIQALFAPPLWRWLQGQVPQIIQTLDVGRRVEEKVRDYPVERMEELVRRVTDRELRLIVRLGYVLGAIIGSALVAVNALLA